MDDDVFCDRLMRASFVLADVIFNPDNPSWGTWPIDLEECAWLGIILGSIFEDCADRIVAELPEEFLARIEEKSRTESRGLSDLLLDWLIECKQAATQGRSR